MHEVSAGMLCCAGPARGARVSALLLLHVNLLLMLFSGAGLVIAARLKWDPSLYVPVRELAPLEYRAAAALSLAAALLLALLAHVAVTAVSIGPRRAAQRPILLTYACVMSLLLLTELAACVWVARRALRWLRSEQARALLELLEARDHLRAALQIFAKWLPLPAKINDLINEVEADLPRAAYASAGAAVALLVLQPAAVVLALLAARARRPRPAPAHSVLPAPPRASVSTLASNASAGSKYSRTDYRRTRQKYHSEANTVSEKSLLRTAYRNGKLVII